MGFTEKQIADLSAKLSKDDVKSRNQAGRKVSYIEGWHVIAEGNRIFGFDAWDRETVDMRQVHEPYQTPTYDDNGNPRKDQRTGEMMMTWRVGYMARVRVTVYAGEKTVVRDGCGFGSGIDKDLGQAHESALKEAETDAMKRAMMTFGNPFGLALYDKSQENVDKGEPQRQQSAPRPQQAPHQTPQQSAPPAQQQESWRKPDRPAEIPVPKIAGKLDLKEWISMLMHAMSQSKSYPEVSEWLKLNGPTLVALKTNAPAHHQRIMDYAASLEEDMSTNPLAA